MLIDHTFRGQEVAIDVTDAREPYEWVFYGMSREERDAITLTDAEEDEIYQLVSKTIFERAATACPED